MGLLRELADLLVPAQILVILGALYVGPSKQYNDWVANKEFADLQRTMLYLLADIMLELIMTAVSCCLLYRRGLRPVEFLRGVIVGGGRMWYVYAVLTSLMYYSMLQHANTGCDFNFRFPWTQDGAIWVA